MKINYSFGQYSAPFSIALAMASHGCIFGWEKLEDNAIDTDYCLEVPAKETFTPYQKVFDSIPGLKETIDFCKYEPSLQKQMWEKILEAEESGLPPTAPLPQSYYDFGLGMGTKSLSGVSFQDSNQYQKREMVIDNAEYDFYFPAREKDGQRRFVVTDQVLEGALETFIRNLEEKKPIKTIYATKEEAHEIYAAHLAHSLWLDKNEIVPWSLSEYNQTQLKELLRPTAWFSGWDDQKEEYSFHLILDHSPRETFSIAREAVGSLSEQRSAMDDIIRSTRPFRHGIGAAYDGEGNPLEHDPMDIVTIPTMKEELISRIGCQTMSPYIVSLANSLNIPGRYLNGYYFAAGHRSALFYFTDDVLAHGDDVYHYNLLGNTPSSEVMGSHDFWEENVLVYPKGDKTAAHYSMLYTYRKTMQYPANILINYYCKKGKKCLDQYFLENEFGPFAATTEINALEKKIRELSNNCTEPFPENNPGQ